MVEQDSFKNEIDRVLKVYRNYKDKGCYETLWHPLDLAETFYRIEKEKALVSLFNRKNVKLEDKNILEIGCGRGKILQQFISLGAKPENLYGIDLLDFEIDIAQRFLPQSHFELGNAENLSYEDEFFDIVMQFVTFSSIQNREMRKNIAREMLRVLKKDGFIIWWDFKQISKAATAQSISLKEIKEIFPNCCFEVTSMGLDGKILSKVINHSWLLCEILARIKMLNSHYLIYMEKEKS